MKKIFVLVLASALLLSLFGCKGAQKEKSLYNEGLELISDIDKMAESDSYLNMMSGDPEIGKIVKDIGSGDYSLPSVVYTVTGIEEEMLKVLTDGQDVGEDIKRILKTKLAPVLPSQINALGGVFNLASANILTHGDSFISDEITSSKTYIYKYDSKYSFIVTFTPTGTGIINAFANVVINEELSKCDSNEAIAQFLKDACNLQNLKIEVLEN